MPIMKTQTIRLHGKNYIRKIKWTGKPGHFYVELPDYVHAVLDCGQLTGDTINEIEEKWDKAIEKFDAAAKTRRRIIVYTYEGHADQDPGRKAKNENEDSRVMDYDGKVSLKFWMGWEVKVAGQKSYLDDNETTQHVNDYTDEDTVVDWTPERERFFKGMLASLAESHKKAEKFFRQSRKKMLVQIDAGTKLLAMETK